MAIPLPLREPAPELVDVLLPAYAPCAGFEGSCKGLVPPWNPTAGHLPRGFRGATGRADEVKLILVCAEPGDPYPGEGYQPPSGEPRDFLRTVYTASCRHLEHRVDQFASNIRKILDFAWPGEAFDNQMRKTWLMESVLCSAATEGASVPTLVEKACRGYTLAQLALFPNARVVALGRKAQQRLRVAGVRFVAAYAASPPGCNFADARQSWRKAVAGLNDAAVSNERSVEPDWPQPIQSESATGKPTMSPTTPTPLSAADGWNRTYSGPERGAQTEFIERALSDVPRTPEEIAIIANLICGKPGFVKAERAKDHLTYHHLTLGEKKRAKRGDTNLRMPQLIHSAGRWSMPVSLRPKEAGGG